MLKISTASNVILDNELDIPSSKSISNRALIIQALSNEKIDLENLSISDDTKILKDALQMIQAQNHNELLTINIGLAGTAFRFLTAFLATQTGTFILTGAHRIKERPIKPLVDALLILGADIIYLEKYGFAPLKIRGKKLKGKKISIDANVSSQFISALLLIVPHLESNFELKLNNKINSKPYINMTLSLMAHFGVKSHFENDNITISKSTYCSNKLFVEADWSSASYFYECLALADKGEILLKNYTKNSIQGDAKLAELFLSFGVKTNFEENQIRLIKTERNVSFFEYDFSNEPDLAQTFISLCAALDIEAKLSGLETLKIKETNRIKAMNTEVEKLAFQLVESSTKGLYLLQKNRSENIDKRIVFESYNDHRMAMCLAPLALKFKNIIIKNPEVVTKSNPLFWKQIEKLGFKLQK